MPKSTEWIIAHQEELADMFEEWEPWNEEDHGNSPLVGLFMAAMERADAERSLVEAIAAARAVGVTWATVGRATGTTGEAARQRYGELVKKRLETQDSA